MSELQELFEAKHPMPKGITRCGDHYAQTEYVLIDPYANEYSARFKGFVEAWNARQKEIDQLKAEKEAVLELAKQWQETARQLSITDDKHVICSLLSCAEEVEKALRGGHE